MCVHVLSGHLFAYLYIYRNRKTKFLRIYMVRFMLLQTQCAVDVPGLLNDVQLVCVCGGGGVGGWARNRTSCGVV